MLHAYLGVRLRGLRNGGVNVQNRDESSLIVEFKAKQDMDPTLIELKKLMVDKKIEVFLQRGRWSTSLSRVVVFSKCR